MAFFNLFITGLFAGFVVVVLVVDLSLRSSPASVYAEAQRIDFIALPTLAPALLVPSILTTLALLVLRRRDRHRVLLLTALGAALLVVTLAITLGINVPLNTIEAGWHVAHPPTDWVLVRNRWQLAHTIRSATTLTAFGVLIAAALQRGTPLGGPCRGCDVDANPIAP